MENGSVVKVIETSEHDDIFDVKEGDVGTVIETVDQDGERLHLIQFSTLSHYMWPCQLQKVV